MECILRRPLKGRRSCFEGEATSHYYSSELPRLGVLVEKKERIKSEEKGSARTNGLSLSRFHAFSRAGRWGGMETLGLEHTKTVVSNTFYSWRVVINLINTLKVAAMTTDVRI